MNSKRISVLFSLGFMLYATFAFGQDIPKEYQKKYEGKKVQNFLLLTSKKDSKDKIILNAAGDKIASFNEKKPLIFIADKGAAYVANNVKGANDGGGFVSDEYQDIDILDLSTNAIKKADFTIPAFPYEDKELVLFKKGGRYGAMNKSEVVVVEPVLKNIIPLSSFGASYLMVADNEYYLADNYGKNILDKNFVYSTQHVNTDWIKGDKILASADGQGFGLYDYVTKQQVVPYAYTAVNHMKDNLYLVKKNELAGVYDTDAKALVLPFEAGVNYVQSVIKDPKSSSLYFVVSVNRNGKNLTNIIHNGKLLVDEKYQLENMSSNPEFPFVDGKNTKGEHYIFDLSQPKMLMNGLPSIKRMTRIEYLDQKPGFVRVASAVDPNVSGGDNRDWVMLLDVNGKVLSGYRPAQDLRRFDLDGGKPILMAAYSKANVYIVNVMFGADQSILEELKLNIINVKVVDNKIRIQLPGDISNVLPSGQSVLGGAILIDSSGKVEYVRP
ncbi:hypothetical protein [Sphingobacterium spiritivorum]|uniref:hypothetical protein n=1 Tax=Sphingobacterium spiritivorum TaxID=258 RepID=UPI001919D67F|nr:hypothetical protein [Sphingobacterium spiritivorum]QQT26417.1 hypothetical protein I6J02_00745 [Sphingobacterium spiritivorum]